MAKRQISHFLCRKLPHWNLCKITCKR